jgi:ABC-type phosphate/phosphonate transport system substrate-binding protein
VRKTGLTAKAFRFLAAVVVLLGFSGCRPAQTDQDREVAPTGMNLRVGYMICDGIEETRERFEPLNRYLQRETGITLEPVFMNTFDIPGAYERGELDITHTNSLLYVIMHESGLLPLAGEKRGSLGFMSAGGIAVRSDSPVTELEDLKGKRMVFGPQLAPTGFLTQYKLLLDAGVDPELDLEYYGIPKGSYKHEKVIYGVWMGAYDAAAVPLLDLELMVSEGRIGPDDLRIIARGDPVPYCVFGVSPSVEDWAAAKIRSALFNLGEKDAVTVGEEVKSVLGAARIDGFVPVEDDDFDRVREMARKANMPPYQEF